MKFNKEMTLTAYNVRYEDLREPKPRTTYEELFIMDQKFAEALATVNLLAPDYIRDKYRKRGYCVYEVSRIKPRRSVSVDLRQLWDDAAPDPAIKTRNQPGAQSPAEITNQQEDEAPLDLFAIESEAE